MFENFGKLDSPQQQNFQTSLVLLIPNCTCHRWLKGEYSHSKITLQLFMMQNNLQLLLKSLNTPADLLSQLCQSISLILRLLRVLLVLF